MPNLVLTDRGRIYYEKLFDKLDPSGSELTKIREGREWMILNLIEETDWDLDTFDRILFKEEDFKNIFRRLFEGGYIDYA